jgi:hypothetical protein
MPMQLPSHMRETGADLKAALPPESAEFICSMEIPVAAPVLSFESFEIAASSTTRLFRCGSSEPNT